MCAHTHVWSMLAKEVGVVAGSCNRFVYGLSRANVSNGGIRRF